MEGVMDQEASEGSGGNRMSDYCRGSKRLIREQKNERWMLQAEQSKEQWIDGSGSKGWIKEKFEGALDQGASCSSGKNRRSDYYA